MNGMSIRTASEQPYYIHPDDQDVFGFAGLWAPSGADANTVTECCSPRHPARECPDLAKSIIPGTRMPAMLAREQRELWLFGTADRAGTALAAYARRAVAGLCGERSNQLA